jgi:hypothetical protein
MPDPVRFTSADLDRLGAKLDTLDLTDDEHQLLLAVFDRVGASASDEVQGHAVFPSAPAHQNVPLSDGFRGALQPLGSQGFAGPNLGGASIIVEF